MSVGNEPFEPHFDSITKFLQLIYANVQFQFMIFLILFSSFFSFSTSICKQFCFQTEIYAKFLLLNLTQALDTISFKLGFFFFFTVRVSVSSYSGQRSNDNSFMNNFCFVMFTKRLVNKRCEHTFEEEKTSFYLIT